MIRVISRSSRYDAEGQTEASARRFIEANIQRAGHRVATLQAAMAEWTENPFKGKTPGGIPPEVQAAWDEISTARSLLGSSLAAQIRVKDLADGIVAEADRWIAKARGSKAALSGWTDDARKAMQASPDYFVWWYTVKSVGLGVVAAWAAYLYGKSKGRS